MKPSVYMVLEKYRKIKGISIDDFIDQIESRRTYYRHMNNEGEIKLSHIIDFVKKTNLSEDAFYDYFSMQFDWVKKQMDAFLSAWLNRHYNICDQVYDKLDLKVFDDLEVYRLNLKDKPLKSNKHDFMMYSEKLYIATIIKSYQVYKHIIDQKEMDAFLSIHFNKSFFLMTYDSFAMGMCAKWYKHTRTLMDLKVDQMLALLSDQEMINLNHSVFYMASIDILDSTDFDQLLLYQKAYKNHLSMIKKQLYGANEQSFILHVYKHLLNQAYINNQQALFGEYFMRVLMSARIFYTLKEQNDLIEVLENRYQVKSKSVLSDYFQKMLLQN